ncbi:MAG: porin [Bacteroidales bacterium]|nr:porin [Bacteroidales bacterium]
MKKHFLTLALSLVFAGITYAQQEEERFEINQYNQMVPTVPLEATARGGVPVLENKRKGYKFWFDSRVQVDFANYHNQKNGALNLPDGNITSVGGVAHPDAEPYMPGGISLRRVRFAVKAEVNENWYGELDFNMANGVFGLQDAYIEYNGLSKYGLQFKAGNFKEDFSMEYTTSSRFVTFMERPMPLTAFNFTRRLGVQAQWLHSDNWLRMSVGVTGQEIDAWQLREQVEEAMKRTNRGSGPNWTGKVVVMPWGGMPDQGLHLGYNIQHRSGKWISDDVVVGNYDPRAWYALRADSRNATAVNRTKYLDTRMLPGVRSSLYQGFELAGYKDGFRFGSEFITASAIMDKDLFNFPTFSGPNAEALAEQFAKNKKFYGFYVQAGYLLFGGKYRYDPSQSEFTQPTRGQKWGDLEVLFRYDYLDLNNGQKDRNLLPGGVDAGRATGMGEYQQGGSGHNFTFGLSYWVNKNVRFTVNYMISQNDVYSNGGAGISPGGRNGRPIAVGKNAAGQYTANPLDAVIDPGVSFNTLQMRLEIAF